MDIDWMVLCGNLFITASTFDLSARPLTSHLPISPQTHSQRGFLRIKAGMVLCAEQHSFELVHVTTCCINTWKHSSAQDVGSSRHTGTTSERCSFKATEPEGLLVLRAPGIGCAVNINNSAHSD